ncbi:MAG: PQQ-like beta-propeller repeat protein [Candidatus Nealsonbacteria bacterium]|nr:PQQ-like beta-propeller repeat protein [Candidatus Nealsonbacteria bacterium]
MKSKRILRVGGVAIATCLVLGACGAAGAADAGKLIASSEPDWPQWRGPRRDAVSDETGLLDTWPEAGPKLVWKATGLGRGWCSPIVTGGTLYVGGDVGEELRIFALDLDGKIKWQVANGKAWEKQFPGSRASCCYSAGMLYQMNGHGRVVCLDAATGKEQWAVNVLERFEAKQPFFGASECLLVDGANVIVTPAGKKALVAALDKKTGKTVWTGTAEAMATETAGYSSPILVELGGRRQIIATTSLRTFAADAVTGKLLWTVGLKLTENACSTIPVFCGDSVFVTNTSREDQASSLLQMSPSGDKAEKAWTIPLPNTSGSAMQRDGNLYVAGSRKLRGFLCLDAKTGQLKAQLPKPTDAATIWADGKLFVLSADGKALLLKPTATSFQMLGAFPVGQKPKKDAWAHPVLCGGRLYLRYHDTLFCYDVKAQ